MEKVDSLEKNVYWKTSWKNLETKMKEKLTRKWITEEMKVELIKINKDRLANVKNLGDYNALKNLIDDANTNVDLFEHTKELDVSTLPSKFEPKEGKIRKIDIQAFESFFCDVCLNPLYKIGFYLCSICYGYYAECKSCYNKKKEINKPHPHNYTMFELNYGIFINNPTIKQRNILSLDGGGIRGYTTILLLEIFFNGVMNDFEEEMEAIGKIVEGNTKVDSSFKYENEFKLKLYLELCEVTLTEEEESLIQSQKKKDRLILTKRIDIFAKHFLRRKFHLLCGTSIGGIIAIMLALEIPFSAIKKLFKERGTDIFRKHKIRNIIALGKPKFKNTGLIEIFDETIRRYRPDLVEGKNPDQLTFEDLELPCGVTSYDLISGKIVWVSTQFVECKEFRLIDAVLMTSAAPTYFPSHSFIYPSGENKVNIKPQKYRCVDGGVWGNDPSTYALFIERMLNAQFLHTHYQCLSFGTGRFHTYFKGGLDSCENPLGWVALRSNDIFEVMMGGTTDMTEKMCQYMPLSGLVMTAKIQVELPIKIDLADPSSIPVQKETVTNQLESNEAMQQTFLEARRLLYMMGQNLESKDIQDTSYDEAERKARFKKELLFTVKARSSRLFDILGLNLEKNSTKDQKQEEKQE